MCFSKDVSLATFLTGFIGGLLCFSTGVVDLKIIGLFFMFVSLMQGIEYLLWIHQTCDDYNKNISYLAMVLNHLQPVVLCILLILYNRKICFSSEISRERGVTNVHICTLDSLQMFMNIE